MAATDTTTTDKPAVKLTLTHLDEYLKKHGNDEPDGVARGLPFARGGDVFFTIGHLMEAEFQGVDGANRQTVGKAIRELGAEHTQLQAKRADGTKVAPSYFRLKRHVAGVPVREAKRGGGGGSSTDPQQAGGQ